MAKERCVLCGKETNLLTRRVIPLLGAGRVFCSACEKEFDRADEAQMDNIKRRVLACLEVEDRESAQRYYDKETARRQEEADKRQREELLAKWRREHPREELRCCDMPMTLLGERQFQLGEHTFFLGDLSHLAAGSMTMAIYRCDCCGQLKFFDPEVLTSKEPLE